jgi:hypothetical protein
MRSKFWGMTLAVGTFVLVTSFQNCGQPGACRSGDKLTCEQESASSKNPYNGVSTGYGSSGSGGSGSSSGGGTTASTGDYGWIGSSTSDGSSNGGGTLGGGGSAGGSSGGSTGGSSGGSTGGSSGGSGGSTGGTGSISPLPLAFTKDLPADLKPNEGEVSDSLTVTVQGASGTLRYQWFKNNVELVGESLRTNTLMLAPTHWLNYEIEGTYYVKVTDEGRLSQDPAHAVITSTYTVVRVQPTQEVCRARTYTIGYNQHDGSFAATYFHNPYGPGPGSTDGRINVVGWYLRYASTISGVVASQFNMPEGSYRSRRTVTCTDPMFRILWPAQYNAKPNQWDFQPLIVGDVTLECRNQKWMVVDGTCAWTQPPASSPPPSF